MLLGERTRPILGGAANSGRHGHPPPRRSGTVMGGVPLAEGDTAWRRVRREDRWSEVDIALASAGIHRCSISLRYGHVGGPLRTKERACGGAKGTRTPNPLLANSAPYRRHRSSQHVPLRRGSNDNIRGQGSCRTFVGYGVGHAAQGLSLHNSSTPCPAGASRTTDDVAPSRPGPPHLQLRGGGDVPRRPQPRSHRNAVHRVERQVSMRSHTRSG